MDYYQELKGIGRSRFGCRDESTVRIFKRDPNWDQLQRHVSLAFLGYAKTSSVPLCNQAGLH